MATTLSAHLRQQQLSGNHTPGGNHFCKDCGVMFESSTSLEVHLSYHKENLLTRWANQDTMEKSSPNNNRSAGNQNSELPSLTSASAGGENGPVVGGINGGGYFPSPLSHDSIHYIPPQYNNNTGDHHIEPSYRNNFHPNGPPVGILELDNSSLRNTNNSYHPHHHHHNGLHHHGQIQGGQKNPSESPSSEILDLDSHKVIYQHQQQALAAAAAQREANNFFHRPYLTHLLPTPPLPPPPGNGNSHSWSHPDHPFGLSGSPGGGNFPPPPTQPGDHHYPPQNGPNGIVYELIPNHDNYPGSRSQPPQQQQQQQQQQPEGLLSFSTPQQQQPPPPFNGRINGGFTPSDEPLTITSSTTPATNGKATKIPKISPNSAGSTPGKTPGKTKGWKGGECKRPKSYNCTACNKWFTSSGHLKRHYGTMLHKNSVRQKGENPDDPPPPPTKQGKGVKRTSPSDSSINPKSTTSSIDSLDHSDPGSSPPPSQRPKLDDSLNSSAGKSPIYSTNHNINPASRLIRSSSGGSANSANSGSEFSNNPNNNSPPMNHSNVGNPPYNHHVGQVEGYLSPNNTNNMQQIPTSYGNSTGGVGHHHQQQFLQQSHHGHLSPQQFSQFPGGPPTYVTMSNGFSPHHGDHIMSNSLPPSHYSVVSSSPIIASSLYTPVSRGQDGYEQPLPPFSTVGFSHYDPNTFHLGPPLPLHAQAPPTSTNNPANESAYLNGGSTAHQPSFLGNSNQNQSPTNTQQQNYENSTESQFQELDKSDMLIKIEQNENIPEEEKSANSDPRSVEVEGCYDVEYDVENSVSGSGCSSGGSPVRAESSGGESTSSMNENTHGNDVLKCPDCSKTFGRACYLTQHTNSSHSGSDKPFKCPTCGKKFPEAPQLSDHAKHGSEKPYKCDICPKQFNHKTDLRRHLCLHTGEKPFVCNVCGKGFIRKDHCNKHSETHLKKKDKGEKISANPNPNPTTIIS